MEGRPPPRPPRPVGALLMLVLLLLPLLLLLSEPPLARGHERRAAKRQALSNGRLGTRIKSIGCSRKRTPTDVGICAVNSFRVAIAGQEDALVLRRAKVWGKSSPTAAAGAGFRLPRELQATDDDVILSTNAIVVVEKSLVVQDTIVIGNVTISANDTSGIQGPPGKRGEGEGGLGEDGGGAELQRRRFMGSFSFAWTLHRASRSPRPSWREWPPGPPGVNGTDGAQG